MSRLRFAVMASSVLAIAGMSWAATPDQTGTFVGSLKTKVSGGTGPSVKTELKIEIAADNSSTVTLGGVIQVSGAVVLGSVDGIVLFADPILGPANSATLAAVHFKGTTVKGSTTSLKILPGPPVTLTEATAGKFKLKKQL